MLQIFTCFTIFISTTLSQSVYDIITNNSNYVLVASAIDLAGLAQDLSIPEFGNKTILAPNNQAFINLNTSNATLYNKLLSDPIALRYVVEYHILTNNYGANDFLNAANYQTLNTKSLLFSNVPDSTFFGDNGIAKLINPNDIIGNNGIMHTIDNILIPNNIPFTVVPTTTGVNINTTNIIPTPDDNAKAIAELEQRVTALERLLAQCNCGDNNNNNNNNNGKGRGGYGYGSRIFSRKFFGERRFSRKAKW